MFKLKSLKVKMEKKSKIIRVKRSMLQSNIYIISIKSYNILTSNLPKKVCVWVFVVFNVIFTRYFSIYYRKFRPFILILLLIIPLHGCFSILITNKQEVICVQYEKVMFVWSNLANTINFTMEIWHCLCFKFESLCYF